MSFDSTIIPVTFNQKDEKKIEKINAESNGESTINHHTSMRARASVNNGRRGQANTKHSDMTIDSYIFIIQDYEFRMPPNS